MTPSCAPEPHPDVKNFLELYRSMDVPSFTELSAEEARQLFEQFLPSGEPSISLASVEDRTVEGPDGEVPIRIYDPGAADGATGDRPMMLYFHGGGWVIGSIETHDETCRKLAADSGYPVVSVDYRLAPEHPFPAGLEDCYAALEWATATAPELDADPERLIVAGDSAGGNLAAATALLARDRGGPEIAYQLLIYPSTGDVTQTEAFEENGEAYFLTAEDMTWFRDHYLSTDVDAGNVYALPRRAADLSGLPPATIVTAGFDPLRDDGAAYARQLEADGVSVTYRNYDDMIHGFFDMFAEPVAIDRAHEAHEDVIRDVRRALE